MAWSGVTRRRRTARAKKARTPAGSHRPWSSTSTTWPCSSTARHLFAHRPATRTEVSSQDQRRPGGPRRAPDGGGQEWSELLDATEDRPRRHADAPLGQQFADIRQGGRNRQYRRMAMTPTPCGQRCPRNERPLACRGRAGGRRACPAPARCAGRRSPRGAGRRGPAHSALGGSPRASRASSHRRGCRAATAWRSVPGSTPWPKAIGGAHSFGSPPATRLRP
jgi:hypothetical protein